MEPYPTGGRDSFVAAVIVSLAMLIIIVLKLRKNKDPVHKQIWDWLKIEDTVIKLSLLALMFVALWLTIRVIGFFGRLYLFDEQHPYNAFEILDILAYILTINLSITLLKSREIREIVSAATQSVLLAIIVFLPRATSKRTAEFYGQHGSAVILVGLSVLIVSLVFASKHLVAKESSRSDKKGSVV